MKQIIIFFASIVLIAIVVFSYNYIQYENTQADVKKFNKIYLEFNKDGLYGTDITTVINKAMDNNAQHKIKKDESGIYIPDDQYSTKIYVNLVEEGDTYPMESFYKVGIKKFTQFFGELKFNCTQINYHSNGRISEMYFQATNY